MIEYVLNVISAHLRKFLMTHTYFCHAFGKPAQFKVANQNIRNLKKKTKRASLRILNYGTVLSHLITFLNDFFSSTEICSSI